MVSLEAIAHEGLSSAMVSANPEICRHATLVWQGRGSVATWCKTTQMDKKQSTKQAFNGQNLIRRRMCHLRDLLVLVGAMKRSRLLTKIMNHGDILKWIPNQPQSTMP